MRALESFFSVMIDAAFALLLWGGVLLFGLVLLPIVVSFAAALGVQVPAALDMFG